MLYLNLDFESIEEDRGSLGLKAGEFRFKGSVPETWVTLYTGDMGYTMFGANGYGNGSNLLLVSSKYPKS